MTQPTSGSQPLSSFGSEYNSLRFIILSILSKIRTATLCKVTSVTNAGGVSPVGFVDLQPLVNQVTGAGVAMAQGAIYHIPYFRLQGGANAIILDPQVGDIGIAIFADSDISNVVTTKAQSSPGSGREFDVSDGLYFGGFLNGLPTQIFEFLNDGAGIALTTPGSFTVNASSMIVNCGITATGDVVGNGISLDSHVHGGVTPGGSDTGVPI